MAVKKEKLGYNETKETLFVGVGGIGSDIVARIAERCRGTEADNLKFVAMDTNANDLSYIKKSKAQIIPIQTSSTQSVLDYLKNDDDARQNWFPNNTTLYSKTVSEGAGQVRAISRLALNATIKTGEIQKLYKAIDELFLKDGGELKQALRVVIVSSAAGGTGSGIAMTTGMLIREYLHKHYREKAAIIRGYLLLPGVMDTVIRTETEKESLRRNGYATIKEINAFMIKSSGFCGVRKELERYKELYIDIPTTTSGVDRLENLPFDFCFLLDRVDKSQESMQTLDQYKEFAAQSLYEQNIGPMQKNAFGIEDNIIKEFANGDNLGRNRFGGIGASVLRYPYEEIVEYVAYSRAIACIGDGNNVGEWLKYDKEFEKELAEYKKKRAYASGEAPSRPDVYVSAVNRGGRPFDIDIKGSVAVNIEKTEAEVNSKIKFFMSNFDNEIVRQFENDPNRKNLKNGVDQLANELDYEKEESYRGHARENLETIRDFKREVKNNAATVAKSAAKSILYDAPSIKADLKEFHVEKLLKNTDGAIHPNAMRYMLYSLLKKVQEEHKKVAKELPELARKLEIYDEGAHQPDFFDVKGGFTSKTTENNFDDVVALENQTPGFFGGGGMKALWDKLNELFPGYVRLVRNYYFTVLREASLGVAAEYLNLISKQYEAFYDTFANKVYTLSKKQDEIVNKLKFREGDSTSYVCAKEGHLKRFAQLCPTGSNELMLPADLSARIFDAIKVNAESERLASFDPAQAKPKTDIFDVVLIDYFKNAVRDECDDILNINIVEAIAREQEFTKYLKAVELNEDDDSIVITPEITDAEKNEYLTDKIKYGAKLASPGIACSTFCEPREVPLCAYNLKLLELRDIDMKKLLEPFKINGTATNTVSKYDIHFFNALYNITPDSLARFKNPEECDDAEYCEEPGIYYKAYHDYIQNIGPDSTKSATISLHIDKRWDSLTEMPEISLDAHYREMLKIHSALIYSIVHGMIITHPSSKYDSDKRIFALENTEGDRTALIVSNNTECDEFYEVLDALYRDRASMSQIYQMQDERCKYDIDSNHRYTESGFFRDLSTFRIGDGHAAPTSIFEIPLVYYNSLPRSKMDDNEFAIMIDSVIAVLEKEVKRYEQENDRKPFLAGCLEAQFKLLVENFEKHEELQKNTTVDENRVVNMIFRKVGNKIKDLGIHNFDDKIDELRSLFKK